MHASLGQLKARCPRFSSKILLCVNERKRSSWHSVL